VDINGLEFDFEFILGIFDINADGGLHDFVGVGRFIEETEDGFV
jgi:hypothetical protein